MSNYVDTLVSNLAAIGPIVAGFAVAAVVLYVLASWSVRVYNDRQR